MFIACFVGLVGVQVSKQRRRVVPGRCCRVNQGRCGVQGCGAAAGSACHGLVAGQEPKAPPNSAQAAQVDVHIANC